jgi:hypothetical protein
MVRERTCYDAFLMNNDNIWRLGLIVDFASMHCAGFFAPSVWFCFVAMHVLQLFGFDNVS